MKPVEEMSVEEMDQEIERRVGRKMEYMQLHGNVLPLYMDWSLSNESHMKLMCPTEDECRKRLLQHLRDKKVGDANAGA